MSFTFVTGCIVFGLWHMSCLYVMLLALNRTVELIINNKLGFLFKETSQKCLLVLPVFYFIYFTFFTKPTFFQSSVSAFLLNPMSNVTSSFDPGLYTVEAYVFNNFFMIFFLGFNYIMICGYLLYQASSSKLTKTSELARKVTYQCLIVCSCHLVGCSLYVYIQYFEMPSWLSIVCHLAWIGNHGLPPVVYTIFNPTVRDGVRGVFCDKKNPKSAANSTSGHFVRVN